VVPLDAAAPGERLPGTPVPGMSGVPLPLGALMRHNSFGNFWCARVATTMAYQMQSVAIGWQIYEMTDSALDLGLIGLVQSIPTVVFSVLVGQAVDHFDRKRIARACQSVAALVAVVLAVGTEAGWLTRDTIFALVFVSGSARAFEMPSMMALVPGIVSPALLPRAIAASTSASQTAVICGPALGGLLYVVGPMVVYGTCALIYVVANILVAVLKTAPRPKERAPVTLSTMFAGFAYVRSRPLLLGAISLDLFVVLVGGVAALLPIFARDILHTGPWGLGLLRSAPAVGALGMSAFVAHRSLGDEVGTKLFASVAMFGVATVVFSLSRSLALSLGALVVYGAMDSVSVVIRQSLVQTRTPADMLGRVIAVNAMFTGTTGSLGQFRAGVFAALIGTVPSALIGGIGAIVVTALWMWWFPDLKRIGSLEPEPVVLRDDGEREAEEREKQELP
jgi:MFS family permease